MTDQELQQLRRARWRLDGRPVRTLDDARAFVEDVGLCLTYPPGSREHVLAPTFIGAFAGCEDRLPDWQHAFADPRAREADELRVRLLREKAAFEANQFGECGLLVAAPLFPYFYGLVGDRNPRATAKPGAHSDYTPLARDVFEAIRKHGSVSKRQLRQMMRGSLSTAALDRALHELWSRLRITRVDYTSEDGAAWDALYRWAPEPVRRGMHLSLPEALSALLSKYLDAVAAAEQTRVEEFFSRLTPKSRVREAVNALLAAREFSFVSVSGKTMLQIATRRHA